MKKCDCLLCSFENPKPCATAIIIKDQKVLVAKRNEEPFKGKWDFVGGYVGKNETTEEALAREIREELGVKATFTYIDTFAGTATYKDFVYPVINFAYLTQLSGTIKLNKKENSKLEWVPLKSLKTIAFDSNQKILKHLKKNFAYDLTRVRQLVSQLDSTAIVDEQSLYKAMLGGYVSKIEKRGKLLGMGWIFPRQTLLRKQAVVEDMIVDEAERGHGYGEKILLDLIAWAKSQGVEVVELTTNPKRLAANALYQKVGFKLHETNHYLLKLD
jgi:8-oxo-dGTP pyrophosphatase MutT (NUDIX family)